MIVALQAHENVVRLWCKNLLWGLTTCLPCALGAVFFSAGLVAITPTIAIAVAFILATIYLTFRTFVNKLALNQRALY